MPEQCMPMREELSENFQSSTEQGLPDPEQRYKLWERVAVEVLVLHYCSCLPKTCLASAGAHRNLKNSKTLTALFCYPVSLIHFVGTFHHYVFHLTFV